MYNPCRPHPAETDHPAEMWGEDEFERGEADAVAGRPFDPPTTDDGFDVRPAPDRIVAAYREGYEHVRFVRDHDAPPVASGGSPALARREAVDHDAADVLSHLLSFPAAGRPLRFDARRKVEAAALYSVRRGGSSLAVPTKLADTTRFEDAAARLAESFAEGGPSYRPTRLYLDRRDGRDLVVVMAEVGDAARSLRVVGYVQDKHAPWLLPLLAPHADGDGHVSAACPVGVYVTAVTGGTDERPTRGVNVCVTGVAEGVRALRRQVAAAAAR